MINALHLWWIVPVAVMYGVMMCAFLSANGRDE